MAISFQLGVSSADAVVIEPNLDYNNKKTKLEVKHRLKDGSLYKYKTGEYRKITFNAEFVPSSVAVLVNSWYDANTELLFFVTSGTATEVFSVMLVGGTQPFGKFQKPYIDQYKGKVRLETY